MHNFSIFLFRALCCYVADMDKLGRYLEEVDKVLDMNQVYESGLVGSEQQCTMNFTTNEVN